MRAFDRGYLIKDEFGVSYREGTEIRRMIVAFIQAMTERGSGVKHLRKYKSRTEENWERLEKITGNVPEWLQRIRDGKPFARTTDEIDAATAEIP